MATERPRVYITLDKDLYEEAEREAKRKKVSLSLLLRDKIRWALEWPDTFEILRDKDAMRTIQESLKEIKEGKSGTPWREALKNVRSSSKKPARKVS